MILTDRQPFTDEDRAILISYKAVVDGVSALIGEHCEIVLHSLKTLNIPPFVLPMGIIPIAKWVHQLRI